MSDLAGFLLARITEDEARLDCGINSHDGSSEVTSATCDCDFREKRECEAKRRIVEWCPDEFGSLLCLAAVYADHPDYREEWKP